MAGLQREGAASVPLSFKPFEQMTDDDYRNLGLKVGLEVHQQLLTQRKLFCRCPAGRYSPEFDAEILRHMRPTLSELGEYDGTALMEKKTRKNIYYRIHRDTVCTYEFDDTPPFFIDDQALDIALEICLLLRLNLVGELHIARKQYLDGSIPTGFQRTGILGVDGWVPYRDRRIRIRQVSIEEDSCREVSDVGHDRVFLTDRLGMPLIEMVTEPDMRTPQEAAEVGQVLRMLARGTGKVRTGYGAGRQDVNVSVEGGTRCEIKGTPQIWRNPRLIYNEARRQSSLLRIRGLLRDRGVRPESFEWTSQDVTRIVAETSYEPLQRALADGSVVKCVLLRGFADILNETTQENTRFAREFADRIRVIACLTQTPNMIHSDLASETLQGRDWKNVRRKMRADSGDDVLILVWGNEQDTTTACHELALRAKEATSGVPNDTRQALKDGTNGFERVLPGAERMYPDTDLPPRMIEQERLERIRVRLPEQVWDREARYRELRVPPDTIRALLSTRFGGLFDRIVRELDVDAPFAAVILVQRFKHWRRAGLAIERITADEIFEVFQAYAAARVSREGVAEVLRLLAEQPPAAEAEVDRVAAIFVTRRIRPLTDEEIHHLVREYEGKLRDRRFPGPAQKARFLIGEIMRDYLGCVEGRRLIAWVCNKLQVPPEALSKRGLQPADPSGVRVASAAVTAADRPA
jgi:glutamyl-tRNA(Gln) amidotransferase subunit E